jgi:hypothetical protein
MLFLTYWELNENMSDAQRLQIAEKLNASGLFPPKGVTIIRWDGTPDLWGILLMEAETAEDAFRATTLWRSAGAGFFKVTKTAPALPIQEGIPIVSDILNALGGT